MAIKQQGLNQPLAEINTTPFVDVMLVLLVIFILAAPLLQQAIPVDLPQVSSQPITVRPSVLQVSIDQQGQIWLGQKQVNEAALLTYFQQQKQQHQTVELELHADKTTHYQAITQVMALAQQQGITAIAFVTQP